MSIWTFWRRKKLIRTVCPFCLTENRTEGPLRACLQCSLEIPPLYTEAYSAAPPLFIQIVGWTNVGKTWFLESLYEVSRTAMSNVWDGFFHAIANQEALEYIREAGQRREKGKVTGGTLPGNKAVHIVQWRGLPRWGGRTLVWRDCAGELFANLDFETDQAKFIAKVPTTFLMIDLSAASDGRTMHELLNSYIATLARFGIDQKAQRRRVIVIFSKADQIHGLPANLREYLESDPVYSGTRGARREQGMAEYLEVMENVSKEIRDWISLRAEGAQLVNMARSYNLDMRFCITSATGQNISTELDESGARRFKEKLQPLRVVDPCFWALHFESQPVIA